MRSVRIPLLIRYPGVAPKRVAGVVAETDVAPGLLGWMGPPFRLFEGTALELSAPLLPAISHGRCTPTESSHLSGDLSVWL